MERYAFWRRRKPPARAASRQRALVCCSALVGSTLLGLGPLRNTAARTLGGGKRLAQHNTVIHWVESDRGANKYSPGGDLVRNSDRVTTNQSQKFINS